MDVFPVMAVTIRVSVRRYLGTRIENFHPKDLYMIKNLSRADRIVRILLAAVMAALYLTHVVAGTLGIVLLVIAIVFAGTAFVSWCPIYTALGIKTLKEKP